MRWAIIAAAAGLYLQASTAAAAPTPPTEAQVAEARALGDRRIAEAKADDLFDNVTAGRSATVRHRPSGVLCDFRGDEGERIVVAEGDRPRGDEVACTGTLIEFNLSTGISRRPPELSLDEAVAMTARNIQEQHPTARPVSGGRPDMNLPDRPPIRTLRFATTEGGTPVLLRISVTLSGQWMIVQSISGPLEKAALIELAGSPMTLGVVSRMQGSR